MRKLGSFPLVTAGALALTIQASSASAGLFRGPYDFSLGPYRGGQGWSYAESYGYYGVSSLSTYPAYGYFPYGVGYFPYTGGPPYPYRYDIVNPAYLLPCRPPGYSIKAMAKDVILPPLNEINGLAAVIDVKMPCFGELWVDGVPTEQLGTDRLFRSPPLEKGSDYVYVLRARWIEEGKLIEQTQQVRVRSGDCVQIIFPKPAASLQP
jgi:uncharacterized protein (TIGR03000 family)